MRDRDAPENYEQLDVAIADARHHHGFGDAVDDKPWMGRRPTMVDSLPMLGQALKQGLFFNFGHQHIGLSMVARLRSGDHGIIATPSSAY